MNQAQIYVLGLPVAVFVVICVGVASFGTSIATLIVTGNRWRKDHAQDLEDRQKDHAREFKALQLRQLYAPLWGLRTQILSQTVFGNVVASATDASLHDLTKDISDETRDESIKLREFARKEQMKDIEFTNAQYDAERLPLYRQMEEVFRDNMGYADVGTMAYFPLLVGYNETWKRHQKDGWSSYLNIGPMVGVSEKSLMPFYDHLDEKVRELRAELSDLEQPRLDHKALVEVLKEPLKPLNERFEEEIKAMTEGRKVREPLPVPQENVAEGIASSSKAHLPVGSVQGSVQASGPEIPSPIPEPPNRAS